MRRVIVVLMLALLLPGVVAAQTEDADRNEVGSYTFATPDGWIVVPDLETAQDTPLGDVLDAGITDEELPLMLYDEASEATLAVLAIQLPEGIALTLEDLQGGNNAMSAYEIIELDAGEVLRGEIALTQGRTQTQFILIDNAAAYAFVFGITTLASDIQTDPDAIMQNLMRSDAASDAGAVAESDAGTGGEGVRFETPELAFSAPIGWYAVESAIADADAEWDGAVHPDFEAFAESSAAQVASGSYHFMAIRPDTLAYLIVLPVQDIGADIDVDVFGAGQIETLKSMDVELLGNERLTLPAGDTYRIDLISDVRLVPHREERYAFMQDGKLYLLIVGVEEALYTAEGYDQVFADMLNTLELK